MDTYRTITSPASVRYTVKMSRFLAFAYPVSSPEEAYTLIKRVANEYHDARHACWAYMLGHDRSLYQSNDNGEPSGTAGKPILGQINSLNLTDVLVVVVRYFGGIKLGTGGLIEAYRTAARMALDEAPVEERHAQATLQVVCSYISLNSIMSAIKSMGLKILSQNFDNTCELLLSVRLDHVEQAIQRLSATATVTMAE